MSSDTAARAMSSAEMARDVAGAVAITSRADCRVERLEHGDGIATAAASRSHRCVRRRLRTLRRRLPPRRRRPQGCARRRAPMNGWRPTISNRPGMTTFSNPAMTSSGDNGPPKNVSTAATQPRRCHLDARRAAGGTARCTPHRACGCRAGGRRRRGCCRCTRSRRRGGTLSPGRSARNTGTSSGSVSPSTSDAPGFTMPAFSRAMSSRVGPAYSV